MTEEEIKLAREWHKYAEDLHAQRMNYGMVAQSMLLVAYVTVVAGSQHHFVTILLEFVIAIVGMFYSYFMFTRLRSVSQRIKALQDSYLKPNDPVFNFYMAAYPSSKFEKRIKAQDVIQAFAWAWRMVFVVTVLGTIIN